MKLGPLRIGMSLGWKLFDTIIVIGGLIVGFCIWFMPNWTESKQMKDMVKAVNERKAERVAYEAAEARYKKQNEEEGIVYFGPKDKFFPGDNAGVAPKHDKSKRDKAKTGNGAPGK